MGKKNQRSQVENKNPQEIIDLLLREVDALAPSNDTAEERFDRFVIMPEIKAKIRRGMDLYESGTNDRGAIEVLEDASSHLRSAQISYFRGALKKRFEPDLEEMVTDRMDEDLVNRAKKHLETVRIYTTVNNLDLAHAGQLYNKACDVLDEVSTEWNQRKERRLQKAAEASRAEVTRKAEEQRAEQARLSREAQERHLAEVSAQRRRLTAGLREKIAV